MVIQSPKVEIDSYLSAGGWQVYGKTYKAKYNRATTVHEEIAEDIKAVLGLKMPEG